MIGTLAQLDSVAAVISAMAPPGSGGVGSVPDIAGPAPADPLTAMGLLNTYAPVFIVAFAVTVLITPVVRRIALSANVVDRPDEMRKSHRVPVAYLGGVAVFFGLLAAIAVSYFIEPDSTVFFNPVPISVVVGMVAIMLTGFADDVWGWDPRLKIAGQLVAAAALAIEHTGVNVANGLLSPLLGDPSFVHTIGPIGIPNQTIFYWVGTAIIAVFVLGGCNAANLIDGLDGLLSGVVAIVATGLLAICLLVAVALPADPFTLEGTLAGARIVLCLALLGAVLGFLPHNFNPATIFLGDCGSLLLGYMSVVVILMLGEQGGTHLVIAGLIVFGVPITDTVLAIIRRKLTGRSMSDADDQHVHHVLLRATGGVKRAVLAMYGFGVLFAVLGVGAAAIVLLTEARLRMLYAVALVVFGFIGAMGLKSARHRQAHLAAETQDESTDRRPAPDGPALNGPRERPEQSTRISGRIGESTSASPR